MAKKTFKQKKVLKVRKNFKYLKKCNLSTLKTKQASSINLTALCFHIVRKAGKALTVKQVTNEVVKEGLLGHVDRSGQLMRVRTALQTLSGGYPNAADRDELIYDETTKTYSFNENGTVRVRASTALINKNYIPKLKQAQFK